jgi:hypothetical protein
MPPRPPYRWKSFWAGILILAFLVGAWTRSMSDAVLWTPWNQCRVSFVTGNATLDIFFTKDAALAMEQGSTHLALDPDALRWFPAPFKSYTSPVGKGVSIAYWLIILLIFDTWLIFLFARWWRRKHQPNPSPSS